ncbi:MAG: hypothetical protein ACD_62C00158G0005 [uncultured bacterium]|nr:MAG: hypothetical protein ACD_62C00158G0005 [uncultured bacterium]
MNISLAQAVQKIEKGRVIAVPTDTVYGLAASIRFPDSIQNIFDIKKRPFNKPLVIQIAATTQLDSLVTDIPQIFHQLKSFWPGPLTMVFEANIQNIPQKIRAGTNTVGIRIADCQLLRELILQTGPLAIPSANVSDFPSAKTRKEVEGYFGKEFPVLDGGPCSLGKESTVVSLVGNELKILRKGVITEEELLKKHNPS